MASALELVLIEKTLPAHGGRITFRDFMDAALNDPSFGFYGSGKARIGARGDFVTSSGLHELFGLLIARLIESFWRELGSPERFDVVEWGPGTGRLAADILASTTGTELGSRLHYTLVEKNPGMQELQETTLGVDEPRIGWGEPDRVTGVVLSNELVDALPVHRLRLRKGKLEEEYVESLGGGLASCWGEPSSPALIDYVAGYCGSNDLEGLEFEVGLDALDWQRRVAASIERGFVVTIDYGDLAESLIGEWSPRGTIRAFKDRRVDGNILRLPGEQDVTASVNFTALIEGGKGIGLETISFASQRAFLIERGLLEELARGDRDLADRLAAKSLLAPGGTGDAMRVLLQRKI